MNHFRIRIWHIVVLVLLMVFTSFMADLATNPFMTIVLLGKYPEQLIIKFGRMLGGDWTPLGSFVFWLVEVLLAWLAYLLIAKLVRTAKRHWRGNTNKRGK